MLTLAMCLRFVSVWHLNLVGVVVGGQGVVPSGTRAAGWACTRIVSTFFGVVHHHSWAGLFV